MALVHGGVLEMEGQKIAMSHVYARKGPAKFQPKKEMLTLVAADRALPVEVRTDENALRELVFAGKVNVIEFELDGETVHFSLQSRSMGMSYSGSKSPSPFAGLAITAERVKGKIVWDQRASKNGGFYFEADVDAVIERTPVEVAPTPADAAAARTSEPARAYMALQAALTRGDKAAMRKLVDPEKAKMMDSPEFPEMLKMVQSMQAKGIQVLKATETDDAAQLVVSGDAGKRRGTVKMARWNGQWRVSRESWTDSQ